MRIPSGPATVTGKFGAAVTALRQGRGKAANQRRRKPGDLPNPGARARLRVKGRVREAERGSLSLRFSHLPSRQVFFFPRRLAARLPRDEDDAHWIDEAQGRS